MAISVFKTWSAGEILSAADLNSSFTQITNNGTAVAFPLTANSSAGGFNITSLALGVSATDAASLQNIYNLVAINTCNLRLTLTSGTAVTTSDVTAATTLYAALYKGSQVGLFDGSSTWTVYSTAEMSIAVPATTVTMYDVFVFLSSGIPALELLAWTNDTTRATALALQDGVYVKSGATTRRYIGSFRTTGSSGQTEDSLAKRFVWNYYNRVRRPMRVVEATDGWSYSSSTIRQSNGSTANQLDMIIGVSEDAVHAECLSMASNNGTVSASTLFATGIGLDVTNAFVAGGLFGRTCMTITNAQFFNRATFTGYPGIGRHFLAWLEVSSTTNTTSFSGDNGALVEQAGIHGDLLG